MKHYTIYRKQELFLTTICTCSASIMNILQKSTYRSACKVDGKWALFMNWIPRNKHAIVVKAETYLILLFETRSKYVYSIIWTDNLPISPIRTYASKEKENWTNRIKLCINIPSTFENCFVFVLKSLKTKLANRHLVLLLCANLKRFWLQEFVLFVWI